MLLSEFIDKLEYLKQRFGDLPIYYLEDHERDEQGNFKRYDIFINPLRSEQKDHYAISRLNYIDNKGEWGVKMSDNDKTTMLALL